MSYRSIYTYPPEQQEIIRARWRDTQRQYRPRYKAKMEAYKAHFAELLRKEREEKTFDYTASNDVE